MILPVANDDFNDSILTLVKVDPVMEFNPDDGAAPIQQRHRKSGLPLWSVTVSYEHEQDFEPENCQIRIASADDPGLVPGPIRFGGLTFRTWNMNGKRGLSIAADTWTQDARPSTRRATPPSPPTPSGTARSDASPAGTAS